MQSASSLAETILALMAVALCVVVPLGIGVGVYFVKRRRGARDR